MKLSERVKRKLPEVPDKPGVYVMRDRNRRVIYVGKALSLRKRLQSYFRQGTLRSAEPKLRGLIRSIDDFDFIITRSEAEATITEGRFIKDYRPRYNVDFSDDKRFLLLRLNPADPFPRFITCRIRKEDGASYFGPYARAGSARATLDFTERRYGLRRCRPRVPGAADYKHCHNDIIAFCSAPCVGKVTPEEYRRRAEEACAFLRGERAEVLREVRQAMEQRAAELDFERAAALRDTLLMLSAAVKQRARVKRTPAMEKEAARAGIGELQKVLGLKTPPRVIETFDVSNISGTHAVGSMVCAVDGLPDRSRYRLYRIRTVEGVDDPGMMAELIRRRYERLVTEKQALPDLVLVDGGVTQARAARAELDRLGLAGLPVAGLAKRFEELYREREKHRVPIRLPLDSPVLRVLQQIRDEAHRFALTYHRKLRSKRIRDSVLDDIPGIGRKRKQLLLEHFGSVDRLRKASEAEIARVPGFGKEMARVIREAVGGRSE